MLENTGKNIKKYIATIGQSLRRDFPNGPYYTQGIESEVNMNLAMEWAKENEAQANQLAVDSSMLLCCVGERMDTLRKQDFFQRCWNTFNGKNADLERANINDLFGMQKTAVKFIANLQKRSLITANCIISIRDQLNTLALREVETRYLLEEQGEKLGDLYNNVAELHHEIDEVRTMICKLAEKINARLSTIECRLFNVEMSTQMHGWLIRLSELHYEKQYPSTLIRMMQVTNEFYQIRNGNFKNDDIYILNKALRSVGINPDATISLEEFVDLLISELWQYDMLFRSYPEQLYKNAPKNISSYSNFVVTNISYSIFNFMHLVNIKYPSAANNARIISRKFDTDEKEAIKGIILEDCFYGQDFRLRWTWSAISIQFLNGLILSKQLISPKPSELKSEDKVTTIIRGKDSIPIFKDVLSFLCNPSTSLAHKRYIIPNKINAYKYDKKYNNEFTIFSKIDSIIVKIGEKLGVELSEDNITFYAYSDGKYYIRAKKDMLAYDEHTNKGGIFKDKRKFTNSSNSPEFKEQSPHSLQGLLSKKKFIKKAVNLWDNMAHKKDVELIMEMERKLVSKLNMENKINEKKAEMRGKVYDGVREGVGAVCHVVGEVSSCIGKGIYSGIKKIMNKP